MEWHLLFSLKIYSKLNLIFCPLSSIWQLITKWQTSNNINEIDFEAAKRRVKLSKKVLKAPEPGWFSSISSNNSQEQSTAAPVTLLRFNLKILRSQTQTFKQILSRHKPVTQLKRRSAVAAVVLWVFSVSVKPPRHRHGQWRQKKKDA